MLRAGPWFSRALLVYLDKPSLERGAQAQVLKCFIDHDEDGLGGDGVDLCLEQLSDGECSRQHPRLA